MEKSPKQNPFAVAEIQLTYKSRVKPSERLKITSSNDCYQILLQHWDTGKIELVEQFKILLVNRAHRVLGIVDISTGGIAGTVADPKIIVVAALKAAACGIIMAHNHPSGNLHASQADLDLTRKIKEGCKFLELQLLDHLIVTTEGYYSFADEGLM